MTGLSWPQVLSLCMRVLCLQTHSVYKALYCLAFGHVRRFPIGGLKAY